MGPPGIVISNSSNIPPQQSINSTFGMVTIGYTDYLVSYLRGLNKTTKKAS